jgi:hypothetical protein
MDTRFKSDTHERSNLVLFHTAPMTSECGIRVQHNLTFYRTDNMYVPQ